jgi:hypothetical protein
MAPRIKPINQHCVQSDHTSPLFSLKNQRSASSALGQNNWLDLMITQVGGVSHPEGRRLSPQWLMTTSAPFGWKGIPSTTILITK